MLVNDDSACAECHDDKKEATTYLAFGSLRGHASLQNCAADHDAFGVRARVGASCRAHDRVRARSRFHTESEQEADSTPVKEQAALA